jgi:SAM-dependent methyltransferase
MGASTTQGKLWGLAANDWAELQEPMHKPLWETMLDEAEVGHGTRFLDAGCGGGGASVLAAKRGAKVSGLDAAELLIRIAQTRIPAGDFRTGDMEALPFDDEAFDAIIAANAVQYTTDRLATLRELRRVCISGKRVVVGLWSTSDKVEFRAFFKAVRDSLPEAPAGGGPFELSSPGKLEELIEQAGLRVLNSGEVNCPFVYPDYEAFWQANVSAGPVQGALNSVGEEKLKAAVQLAIEPFQKEDGRIQMDNQFRYVTSVR